MKKNLGVLVILALLGGAFVMATKAPSRGDGAQLGDYGVAPPLAGINQWFNSAAAGPDAAKGKPVLLEFWSYGCINCIHTLPQLNRWHEKYATQGLQVIGVHTPEFDSERETSNLQKAIQRYNIKYPVGQDNDRSTWNAFGNEFWPAAYLINKKGVIVLKHVGEGDYEDIEKAIRKVLEEQ